MAAAEKLDPRLEEAARSLGASPFGVLRDVLLAGIAPALAAAGANCFATATGAFGTAFALASRIDRSRESQDGAVGRQLLDEVNQKIDILQAPPPSKKIKALPLPDEGYKKRRAGKRCVNVECINEKGSQTKRIFGHDRVA